MHYFITVAASFEFNKTRKDMDATWICSVCACVKKCKRTVIISQTITTETVRACNYYCKHSTMQLQLPH